MDICLNTLIVVFTLYFTLPFFRKDGRWHFSNGIKAFRYFTVQSNILCAVSALLMCFAPTLSCVWTMKYIGTAAVTVTMLTVVLFLGPTLGYKSMFTGSELFMHLVTPVLAIVSFFCFEKRGMTLAAALPGVLPVLLYSGLYLYKVLLAPAEKRWEDFYGFNRGGKWPVSLAAMLTGNLAVCLAFMFLQNR